MNSVASSLHAGVGRLQQRSARGVPASEAIQEAAEFQRDAVAAQAAWFQQRVAGLYADQVAVAQQQRSRETMSSYCRLDAGTNLCAITINTAALRELQSLHTGWWADQQRQQQQAAAQLMQELGVGGEPEAQEAARAAALAEAQAAAAAVPAGLVATAASACAALGNGGAMVGAAGWLLRRRRCAEAAAAVGEAARTVQGMLAGMAVGRPGAAALAAALVEQRFARMASTAAAEAFGSTPAAQAAVSAALDLGRSYDGGGGGPAMAPMLFDRHFPRGSKVLAFGMVVGLQHAREWAARHSQAEFSIPRPPLLALAEMGAAPSLQQLQVLLARSKISSGGRGIENQKSPGNASLGGLSPKISLDNYCLHLCFPQLPLHFLCGRLFSHRRQATAGG